MKILLFDLWVHTHFLDHWSNLQLAFSSCSENILLWAKDRQASQHLWLYPEAKTWVLILNLLSTRWVTARLSLDHSVVHTADSPRETDGKGSHTWGMGKVNVPVSPHTYYGGVPSAKGTPAPKLWQPIGMQQWMRTPNSHLSLHLLSWENSRGLRVFSPLIRVRKANKIGTKRTPALNSWQNIRFSEDFQHLNTKMAGRGGRGKIRMATEWSLQSTQVTMQIKTGHAGKTILAS